MNSIPLDLERDLQRLGQEFGAELVASAAESLSQRRRRRSVCTIIVNAGLHVFPPEILIGEIFEFSVGNISMETELSLQKEIEGRLIRLALFLREQRWEKIYVVISGPAALCMQVKLAVFRVTHIETIDWVYDSSQARYLPIQVEMRKLIAGGHLSV